MHGRGSSLAAAIRVRDAVHGALSCATLSLRAMRLSRAMWLSGGMWLSRAVCPPCAMLLSRAMLLPRAVPLLCAMRLPSAMLPPGAARPSAAMLVLGSILLFSAGCASQEQGIRLSDHDRMNAFLEDVRDDIEAHAWDNLFEVAEEKHHRVQVLEMGMSEPQYVAELFGLHTVGNDIGGGEAIQWDHLRRIETVHFERLEASTPREWIARGHVVLDDGRHLDIVTMIAQREGAYRLTGAVG